VIRLNNLSQRGFLSLLLLLFAILTVFSMFFGFSYDESTFASRAALYYYYGLNPLYYLQMGSFFIPILMGGYFPTVVLSIFGLHNAISIEVGVKLPMDLAVLVGSLIIYRILETNDPTNTDKTGSRSIALLYMINPVTVFFIFFQGNELSVTLMFLLAAIYFYLRGRPVYASAATAVASTLYLFPFFIAIPLLLLTARKFGRRLTVFSGFIFLIVSIIGLVPELVIAHFYGVASEGTIISGSSGPLSLSASVFAPSVWSLYFIPYTLLNIKAPYLLYQIAFGLLVFVPATYMAYILSKNNSGEMIQLAMPLAYVGLGFAMLSPTADPQYIIAALPFILILWFYNRSDLLVTLYLIASFLSVLLIIMVSPYTLGQYYMDVYPSAANLIVIPTTGWMHTVAYASYFIFSLATVAFLLSRVYAVRKGPRKKWKKLDAGKFITASLLFAVAFMVFSAAVIAPGISHVPQELAFNENTQYQYSPQISNGSSGSYSYLNFTTSPDLKLLSSSVLKETAVGLYFRATPVLHTLGYYGSNATYRFNRTRSYFVSYSIPFSSQVTANLLFVNESYRFARISVISGLPNNMGNEVSAVSADSGRISFFHYLGKNVEYLDALNLGNLTNGNYTMVVSSASGAQGSIGGWANTTDLHGFIDFGFISGNSSTHDVHVMKSGYFSVLDYGYSGAFSFIVNGHNVSLNPTESNGEYVARIPAELSTYVLNITVNSGFFSEFHNPTVIFLFPFPESGRLALNNTTAFIFGLASFTAMVSLAFIVVRRLY
jgi:hypothetical protein